MEYVCLFCPKKYFNATKHYRVSATWRSGTTLLLDPVLLDGQREDSGDPGTCGSGRAPCQIGSIHSNSYGSAIERFRV